MRVLTAVVALAAAALVLAAWQAGMRSGAGSPWFVVPLLAATATAAAGAHLLRRTREHAAFVWLSAALLAYLVLTGASTWWAGALGRRDAAASLLVALHTAWYAAPLVLTQVAALVVAGRARPLAPVLLGLCALSVAAAIPLLPVGDPAYPGLGPLQPTLPAPALDALGWALNLPWMAGLVAVPVVLWWAVPRAPGRARPRAALVAIAALLPVCTIVLCVLGGELALTAGLLPHASVEDAIGLAFGLGIGLAAAVLTLAARGPEERVATLAPRVAGTGLTVVLALIAAMVVVFVSTLLGARLGDGGVVPVVLITLVVAASAVPVHRKAVRALTLRMDPARAAAARHLRAADPAARTSPARLARSVLRRALADDAATLLLRLPEGHGWVDPDGIPGEPDGFPVPGPDGAPHAYVRTGGDPLDVAGPATELAGLIDAAVLEAAVHDRDVHLSAERARADTAAVTERRRMERDLHDGVQGRLLAMALDLRLAQEAITDGAAQLVLADTVSGLRTAIDELRMLAAGDAPALLARAGLAAALADLAGRVPLTVHLDVPERRLPPGTETVAYLVVCEAVTNVLKHAAAATVAVHVTSTTEVATVEVLDDGRGGADLRAGTGLRGLAERVAGAGGRLVVSDRAPHGTRLEVTLPCAP